MRIMDNLCSAKFNRHTFQPPFFNLFVTFGNTGYLLYLEILFSVAFWDTDFWLFHFATYYVFVCFVDGHPFLNFLGLLMPQGSC